MAGLGGLIALAAGGAFGPAYEKTRKSENALGDVAVNDARTDALSKVAMGNALALLGQGGGMSGGLPSPGSGPSPGGGGVPGGGSTPPPPGAPSVPMQWPPGGAGGPMPPSQGAGPMPPGAPPWAGQGMPGAPPVPPMNQQPGMAPMQGMRPPQPGMPAQRPPMPQAPSPAPGAPPPGAGGAMRPPGGGIPQGGGQLGSGQLDWRSVVQAVQKANPGVKPEVLMHAVNNFLPMMNQQSRQEWQQVSLQIREQQIQERERQFMMADQTRRDEGDKNRGSREGMVGARIESRQHLAEMTDDRIRDIAGDNNEVKTALERARAAVSMERNPTAQAFSNFLREKPNATPEEQATYIRSLKGGAGGNMSQGQVGDLSDQVKAIGEGRAAMPSPNSRAAGSQELRAKVFAAYPDFDEKTFPINRSSGMASERARASAEPRADANSLTNLQKSRDSVEAFTNTAIANGERLRQLADKVDYSGAPVIDRWVRAGRQATGDTDVAKFNAQLQLYRTEVAKIMTNPNIAGQLTDSARREIEAFMGGGTSAAQIRSLTELLESDFINRKKAIDAQITEVKKRLDKGGSKKSEDSSDSPVGFKDIGGGWSVQEH